MSVAVATYGASRGHPPTASASRPTRVHMLAVLTLAPRVLTVAVTGPHRPGPGDLPSWRMSCARPARSWALPGSAPRPGPLGAATRGRQSSPGRRARPRRSTCAPWRTADVVAHLAPCREDESMALHHAHLAVRAPRPRRGVAGSPRTAPLLDQSDETLRGMCRLQPSTQPRHGTWRSRTPSALRSGRRGPSGRRRRPPAPPVAEGRPPRCGRSRPVSRAGALASSHGPHRVAGVDRAADPTPHPASAPASTPRSTPRPDRRRLRHGTGLAARTGR